MKGQYSLFDNPNVKTKPSEYAFKRYIGQKVVNIKGEVHTIVGIEPYYTYFENGTIGTPHDITPVDRKEKIEMWKVDIAYEEQIQSKEHDSISRKNIEILKRLLGEE